MVYMRCSQKLQQFDYSKVEEEKEFTCASASPSGEALVLGSFDRCVHITLVFPQEICELVLKGMCVKYV